MTFDGGCLCGAVRYRAAVEPTVSMVCHCRSCRGASGAPLVPWVTFPFAAFRFVRGRPVEHGSSPAVVRTFCGACGTPLTYRHADLVNEIDVTTCTLDDPERFPPRYHSWTAHDLAWVRVGDGLPAYERSGES